MATMVLFGKEAEHERDTEDLIESMQTGMLSDAERTMAVGVYCNRWRGTGLDISRVVFVDSLMEEATHACPV